MKLGIFTDSHYSSATVTCGNRYNSQSLRKIREALAVFHREECDRIICLGDLIDREEAHSKEIDNLKEVAAVFAESKIPITCVMGNHDAFAFTPEEFYSILGEQTRPADADAGNLRMLFLDACYFASGVHYAPGDSAWEDTFYPDIDALREKIPSAPERICLFLHQNIDPTVSSDHCLANAAQIRTLLEQSGRECTVFQGHYHPGTQTEQNGVRYRTFPAMCSGENVFFVLQM